MIIKNNEKRVHIIGATIIPPLKTGKIPDEYKDNRSLKALIETGKLSIVTADEAKKAEVAASKLIEKREKEELDALKEKATELGIKNADKMKKETLILKIAEAQTGA